jgi:Uma2 family endonuclease
MSAVPVSTPIPPLQDGARLTRADFERRYEAMPHIKKAELIEGVVYMPSPVRVDHHASPHVILAGCAMNYWGNTPGVQAADDASVRLDMGNEPQPDVLLFILPSHGGQARISTDNYIEGAPELVCEVAASSASVDLNAKLRIYQRNGVREYVVWRPLNAVVDRFVPRDNHLVRLPAGEDGVIRSEAFPGLWLDTAALARLDVATVLRVLQQGLNSPDHAAFVERLRVAANR